MSVRLAYRWIVFLLAGFYSVYLILIDGSYQQAGGPFRFLTIWALLASFFCASRMLAMTQGRSDRDWPVAVAVTATLNVMVVYLYWSLWLKDPALVQGSGTPRWWIEYYVHLLGPLLQWGDTLLLHRRLRRFPAALAALLAIVAAYIFWIEAVVRPLADRPLGSVTDGLPYPFLNSLEPVERALFYGQTAVGAVLVLCAVFMLVGLVRRARGEGWRPIPRDSRDRAG